MEILRLDPPPPLLDLITKEVLPFVPGLLIQIWEQFSCIRRCRALYAQATRALDGEPLVLRRPSDSQAWIEQLFAGILARFWLRQRLPPKPLCQILVVRCVHGIASAVIMRTWRG